MGIRADMYANTANVVNQFGNSLFNAGNTVSTISRNIKAENVLFNSECSKISSAYESEYNEFMKNLPYTLGNQDYESLTKKFTNDFVSRATSSGNFSDKTIQWLNNDFISLNANRTQNDVQTAKYINNSIKCGRDAKQLMQEIAIDPQYDTYESMCEAYSSIFDECGYGDIDVRYLAGADKESANIFFNTAIAKKDFDKIADTQYGSKDFSWNFQNAITEATKDRNFTQEELQEFNNYAKKKINEIHEEKQTQINDVYNNIMNLCQTDYLSESFVNTDELDNLIENTHPMFISEGMYTQREALYNHNDNLLYAEYVQTYLNGGEIIEETLSNINNPNIVASFKEVVVQQALNEYLNDNPADYMGAFNYLSNYVNEDLDIYEAIPVVQKQLTERIEESQKAYNTFKSYDTSMNRGQPTIVYGTSKTKEQEEPIPTIQEEVEEQEQKKVVKRGVKTSSPVKTRETSRTGAIDGDNQNNEENNEEDSQSSPSYYGDDVDYSGSRYGSASGTIFFTDETIVPQTTEVPSVNKVLSRNVIGIEDNQGAIRGFDNSLNLLSLSTYDGQTEFSENFEHAKGFNKNLFEFDLSTQFPNYSNTQVKARLYELLNNPDIPQNLYKREVENSKKYLSYWDYTKFTDTSKPDIHNVLWEGIEGNTGLKSMIEALCRDTYPKSEQLAERSSLYDNLVLYAFDLMGNGIINKSNVEMAKSMFIEFIDNKKVKDLNNTLTDWFNIADDTENWDEIFESKSFGELYEDLNSGKFASLMSLEVMNQVAMTNKGLIVSSKDDLNTLRDDFSKTLGWQLYSDIPKGDPRRKIVDYYCALDMMCTATRFAVRDSLSEDMRYADMELLNLGDLGYQICVKDPLKEGLFYYMNTETFRTNTKKGETTGSWNYVYIPTPNGQRDWGRIAVGSLSSAGATQGTKKQIMQQEAKLKTANEMIDYYSDATHIRNKGDNLALSVANIRKNQAERLLEEYKKGTQSNRLAIVYLRQKFGATFGSVGGLKQEITRI